MVSCREGVPGKLDDQHRNDDKEKLAHKSAAVTYRQPAADLGAADIAEGHTQGQSPQHMSGRTEIEQRRRVCGQVHDLGGTGGTQEVQPEKSDKQEKEEAAGTGPEEAVVETNAGAEQQGQVMGVAQSTGALSRVLGPMIAGALFGAFGRNAPFLWGAVLVAIALAIAWRLPRAVGVPLAAEPRKPVGAGE